MTFGAVWIVLSAFGVALVYFSGLWIERWSSALGLTYFVMLAPAALIAGWVAADQVLRVDHANCKELDPSPRRLQGASPLEFRARCIATQDNSEWLVLRQSG